MSNKQLNQNMPDCPIHTHGTGIKRVDNTQLVITESYHHTSEEDRKSFIQRKTDKWIKQQLEREGLPAGTVNSTENTV